MEPRIRTNHPDWWQTYAIRFLGIGDAIKEWLTVRDQIARRFCRYFLKRAIRLANVREVPDTIAGHADLSTLLRIVCLVLSPPADLQRYQIDFRRHPEYCLSVLTELNRTSSKSIELLSKVLRKDSV
jgi:hypothetical protein